MPNGTASGSVSRIVNGCRKDSNCAASTMYMKISVSAIGDAEVVSRLRQVLADAAESGGVAGIQMDLLDDDRSWC